MKYIKTFENFSFNESNQDIYDHLDKNIDPNSFTSFSQYHDACIEACGRNEVPKDLAEYCKDCWEERNAEEVVY